MKPSNVRFALALAFALPALACGTSGGRAASPPRPPAVTHAAPVSEPRALASAKVETDDPLAWKGEPYAPKKEAPELASSECAWLMEAMQAFRKTKKAGTTEDALLSALTDAAKAKGAAGPKCLELLRQGLVEHREASKNIEAKVHLSMMDKRASESPACLETAPPVPRTREPAPYRSSAADWAAPGWNCLGMDFLAGQPSRFRLAFTYEVKSGVFVAAAERLDDPQTVLFIRGKASDPTPKVVMRRVFP